MDKDSLSFFKFENSVGLQLNILPFSLYLKVGMLGKTYVVQMPHTGGENVIWDLLLNLG